MTHPTPPPANPYLPPPLPRKSNTGRNVVLITIGVVLVMCVAGLFIAAIAGAPTDKQQRPLSVQDQANRSAAAAPATTEASSAPAPTTAAPAATTKAAPAKPQPVIIGDGTYRVGEDIPAGRYKVVERAGELCYWTRNKGDDIVANNIGGGFPQFTARTGEDVQIMGCPEFQRLGN